MSYQQEYQTWLNSPESFWLEKAKEIDWFEFPTIALSQCSDGLSHWFADGLMNTCYLALDSHVQQGRGEQTALVYDSPVTDTIERYSYNELLDKTSRVAGMLTNLGVTKGDTVIIYMPMIPEAAMAMLACTRIGAIHSVVFGGFASPELASRIDDAKPKVILTASCGIEINRIIEYKPLIDGALKLSKHQPSHCVVLQREQARTKQLSAIDIDWHQAVANAEPAEVVPVRGDDPLYILYTSGTTGKPKGVLRENGGHAVALNYSMSSIYGMQTGDTFWSASDVGWVVGHSYIVYGPLIKGCTTVFYEGKPIMTPDAGAFWRVIQDHKVNAIFSAPTAFRAIRREDPDADLINQYDISSLRHVFAAGERLDPPTQDWMTDKIGVDVIDNWWQTETGWPISANMTGIEKLPIKSGSATKPTPGFEIHILDHEGNQLGVNQQGYVAIKLPLPPSCLPTIWGDNERFHDAYLSQFEGYYTSGDGGYFDEDGYLFVMGRVDDVINVAGHRLSTGDIEEVLGKHPQVAECAVVARRDELKGELPVGFVILKSNEAANDIQQELIDLVRQEIGAVACYKESIIVPKLPKTRSGKILRKTIKAIINGDDYTFPATIDDPSSLDELKKCL